ncbi:hypothetical protein BaRGS_00006658, partial [Batillaria attramentaria]
MDGVGERIPVPERRLRETQCVHNSRFSLRFHRYKCRTFFCRWSSIGVQRSREAIEIT